MNLSSMKPTAVLTAAAVLALPGLAPAQSHPADLKGHARYLYQSGSRAAGPVYQAPRAAMPFGYAPSYGYAPAYAVAPAAPAAPTVSAAPGTVAVTGPDGVVRYFPAQGATVQQQAGHPGQPSDAAPAVSTPAPAGPVYFSPSPAVVWPPCYCR